MWGIITLNSMFRKDMKMSLRPIIKDRIQTQVPSITVTKTRISFNASFMRIARTDINKYVRPFVDEPNRKLVFIFADIPNDNYYKLVNAKTLGVVEIQKLPWVKQVSQFKVRTPFPLKQDGEMWVATLCPAFELRFKREDAQKTPTSARGI